MQAYWQVDVSTVYIYIHLPPGSVWVQNKKCITNVFFLHFYGPGGSDLAWSEGTQIKQLSNYEQKPGIDVTVNIMAPLSAVSSGGLRSVVVSGE